MSRRRALFGGAALVGGTAAATVWPATGAAAEDADARSGDDATVGSDTVPFEGVHQAGVVTAAQAFSTFAAYDLTVTEPRRVVGLLRILTDDIRRMTAGRAALADTAPELAATPARLTVTLGFGPGLFTTTGLTDRQPTGLTELPAFPAIDRLDPAWSGGDLLIKISADDPMIVAHAHRMLHKDTRPFTRLRWTQRGFLNARGAIAAGATGRNLMGQLDGTVNPSTDAELDSRVWAGADAGWFAGGTTLVLRRIRMDLDRWDELDPAAMDATIGRRQRDGSPLSGTREYDEPDFTVPDATGLPAIADFAHIKVARGDGPARQILRRPYNYDDTPTADGGSDSGQIFCSYQADIAAQFVPIQQRLAERDLFNQWTTPIGSAVFAIPPGSPADGYLGQGLFA
ncbi:Dyp-type peroxidase [Nakamurella flava]|uniref:Dyp-type peroxidase n=1 Tax=Nakamurella flava TaxID=2576308 RepID=A0A4U6QNA2_9ACTN|nr:Dyp-type peroxidase [Nakamurella flava]